MRIGIGLGTSGAPPTLEALIDSARRAEAAGFDSVWLSNIFGLDALTVLAIVGREVGRIELGTFVVPTYPRHPTSLAQQALSVQAATGGRLALGIGLSHQIVIEGMFGLDYSHPARHMREYLTVLNPLLAGEQVRFTGEEYRVNAQLTVPGATKPPIIVAALGPVMLRLAGRLADGTATWMGGLAYLRDFAVPAITAAAEKAGRGAPRVVAGLPVCVTNNPEAARAAAGKVFQIYGQLPSYRATLDRGGAGGPADVAVVGTEKEVTAQIRAFGDVGVTDFMGNPFTVQGEDELRTYELLAALARHPVGAPAAR